MTRSTKTGIASLIFVAIAMVGAFTRIASLGFAAAVIAWILGVLAGQQGDKKWLLIPMLIIMGFGFVVFHAR